MRRLNLSSSERLIVALDVPTMEAALALVERLPSVSLFKIGLEAYAAGFGNALRMELYRRGRTAMVDLKLHDIDATVERATAALNEKALFVTVHATSQVMRAAQAGVAQAKGRNVSVLAVTVLTSLKDEDLREDGYAHGSRALVLQRALRAASLGVCGVVASPEEVSLIRGAVGDALTIVTPGVRPLGAEALGQKRIGTPRQAILDGADYVVVGRPIRDAPDPTAAALAIQGEILIAMQDRAQLK